VAAAVFGAWLGWRRYRHTLWLLDADGFGLRRGRLWQSDTRVPGSRVQHLDIRRGPLERHFRLATLVIHTAGTRHSEVSVSGLDADDAERLRDHLACQTDDDDDASD
jgi:membrane protein YdbS with pleckstrin-like domain